MNKYRVKVKQGRRKEEQYVQIEIPVNVYNKAVNGVASFQMICDWRAVGTREDSYRWEVPWGKKLFTCLLVLVLIDLNLRPEGRVVNRESAGCD